MKYINIVPELLLYIYYIIFTREKRPGTWFGFVAKGEEDLQGEGSMGMTQRWCLEETCSSLKYMLEDIIQLSLIIKKKSRSEYVLSTIVIYEFCWSQLISSNDCGWFPHSLNLQDFFSNAITTATLNIIIDIMIILKVSTY